MLEYDGSSGAAQRWYAYGPGPNAVLNQMNVAAGTRATLIPDIQGSVIGSLDSGGTLTKIGYQPFGEHPGLTSGGFRYTGQRQDPETAGSTSQPSGLYYYRSRMYSPGWGRFLQPDAVGYTGGFNLYAYTSNDSLDGIDPNGTVIAFIGGGGDSYFRLNGIVGSFATAYASNPANSGRSVLFFPNFTSPQTIAQVVLNSKESSDAPVIIVGHSWGGATAAEVATVLSNSGQTIDLLATIDPVGIPILNIATADQNVADWVNIRASASDVLNSSNIVKQLGGGDAYLPYNLTDANVSLGVNHEDFVQMISAPIQNGQSIIDTINGLYKQGGRGSAGRLTNAGQMTTNGPK